VKCTTASDRKISKLSSGKHLSLDFNFK